MRLDQPRLAPLAPEEMPAEIAEMFGDFPLLNIFRTIAHHPELMKRWMVFGNHVLGNSSLSPRDRELAILRVGSRCRSGYEWSQHVRIALDAGLSEEEIAIRGPHEIVEGVVGILATEAGEDFLPVIGLSVSIGVEEE